MHPKAVSQIDKKDKMRGTVVGTDDPTMEGRIKVLIPKLMLKADPSLAIPTEEDRPIDNSIVANTGVKKIISSSVKLVNFVWARPVFNNEYLVPYVGQTVYCFLEDGDPNKIYYEMSSPTLDGEVTPMEKVKNQANVFDPKKKPFIHVIKEFADGTIIYYDENDQRLAITYRNNHSISINNNEKDNHIELITNSNHKVILDQKNEFILLQSSKKHSIILDDKNKKISANTTNGHSFMMDDIGKNIITRTTGGNTIDMNDTSKKIDIKTTGGHNISMDDTGKNISAITSGGQSIIQSDTSKTISIQVAGGGSVVVNPTGVIFSSIGLGKIMVTPAGVTVN